MEDFNFYFNRNFEKFSLPSYEQNFDFKSYLLSLALRKLPKEKLINAPKIRNKEKFLNDMNKSIILDLLFKDHKPSDISKVINADIKLCYRLNNRFKTLKQCNKSNNDIKTIILNKKYHNRKFTNKMENCLADYLELNDNKFDIAKKIKMGFESHYESIFKEKIQFHQNTYNKILNSKNRMNYSLKQCPRFTVYYNNSSDIKSKRESFVKNYLFWKSNGFRIIHLDEFGISQDMHPNKGWTRRGIKLRTKNNISKSRNLSVVCGIDENGLVNYKIYEGSTRSSDFYLFLFEMIEKNNLLEEKFVFIMDNAYIHNSRFEKKADNLINISFLPEYSPMLNPIESFFSFVKGQLRQKFYRNENELIENLKCIINNAKLYVYKGFYAKLLETIQDILDGRDI